MPYRASQPTFVRSTEPRTATGPLAGAVVMRSTRAEGSQSGIAPGLAFRVTAQRQHLAAPDGRAASLDRGHERAHDRGGTDDIAGLALRPDLAGGQPLRAEPYAVRQPRGLRVGDAARVGAVAPRPPGPRHRRARIGRPRTGSRLRRYLDPSCRHYNATTLAVRRLRTPLADAVRPDAIPHGKWDYAPCVAVRSPALLRF